MATRKKKEDSTPEEVKEFEIMSAAIKDDFCNYEFKVNIGTGIGDVHKVSGKGVIDQDMTDAFRKFNVHLAAIDDVFSHSGIEVENIDLFHSHELTQRYNVTGFKVKGTKDNESVILIGTKYVNSSGERMDLEAPKIPLDDLSSYKWYNELRDALNVARTEVELYKNGKCTPVEVADKEDSNQLKITDQIADVDFETGKV